MGTMNLATLRSELLFDLRNRSDTATAQGISTTRQNLWVNAAYLHICHPSVFRHQELMYTFTIPLVTGQSAYTFNPISATTITAIRSISHALAATDDFTASRTKLLPRDRQWFAARTHNSGGVPRNYFVERNQIILSPVPNATVAGTVLSLSTWQEPAALAADGDVTVLSTRFDEVLLLASRWRAELHLGYRDLAEATKIDFTSLLNEYQSFEQLQGEDWDWMADVRTESTMEQV